MKFKPSFTHTVNVTVFVLAAPLILLMDILTHRMDAQPILSVTSNTILNFDGHGDVTCKQSLIVFWLFQARLDKNNLENMIKKAMQTSAKFNAELNRERKEERRAYFDLQTNVSTIRSVDLWAADKLEPV